MDAFTVAAELIPGIALDAGQLAQLRAINQRHYDRLAALTAAARRAHGPAGPQAAEPTAQQASQLRAMLVDEIRALLSPEQRRAIDSDET